MDRKTILVTAVGSFSAAAVIETYKKAGHRVLGCDIYPAEWIAASGEVDGFYQAPYAVDEGAYLDFLGRVCRREHVDMLVPLTDVEVDVINGWRAEAEALGVTVCLSPEETIRLCRDKWAAAEKLRRGHICRTIPTRRLSEAIAAEADTGYELMEYPLVLKPDHGRSSQGLRIIQDAAQMRHEMERLAIMADFYLVQPKIEGHVVTVDVVRNVPAGRRPAGAAQSAAETAQRTAGAAQSAAGTVQSAAGSTQSAGGSAQNAESPVQDFVGQRGSDQVVCIPRRELLRTGNGAGTSVYVFRNERLEAQCASIARALDIRGCVNFEFVEESEGRWYFLECNPRFSGGVAFSCMAGYDMPDNHLRCFAGEAIAPLGEIRNQYLVKRYTEYCMKIE